MAGTAARSNVADFALSVDGIDLTDRARPRLRGLGLTEKRGGEADDLDITLDDSDGRLALPRKGALIRLSLGWARGADVTPGLVDKGRFTVDQVGWHSPPGLVTIKARSADLTAALQTRREYAETDTTLGAIVRRVAAAHGLQARIDAALADQPISVLDQHQQSDIALVRRLGRANDAVATIKDRTLIVTPIGAGKTATGKALATIALTWRDLSGEVSYEEVDRSNDAGVEARWHDAASATRKTVRSGGTGGAGSASTGADPRRLRRVYHSEAEAQRAADAAAARARRAEATLDCTLAFARPDLSPECPVTFTGLKDAIDTRQWVIAELAHRLEADGGFKTKLKLETKG